MTEARPQEPTRHIVTNAAAPQPHPAPHKPCVDASSPPAERPPVERTQWRIPTDPPPV